MKLTALICVVNRPASWALCEKYLLRQTIKPDQILVLDCDSPPTKFNMDVDYIHCPEFAGRGSLGRKINYAVTAGLITGDALAIIEDDWYSPRWLQWCAFQLGRHELVGEGNSIYYNARHRAWYSHPNTSHASLCATAMRRSAFQTLAAACDDENPFIDSRLWPAFEGSKRVFDPKDNPGGKRMVIGIKGMPGRAGYGYGHQPDASAFQDPMLKKLRELIGEDARLYEKFNQVKL